MEENWRLKSLGRGFNAGEGKGVEVPVKLRFSGNRKYLQNLCSVIEVEHLKQESFNPTEIKGKFPTDVQQTNMNADLKKNSSTTLLIRQ